MKTAALTTLFAGLTAAAPQSTPTPPDPDTYENIDIADFTIRKDSGPDGTTINVVYFKLSGKDATDLVCEASSPGYPSEVITCGETKYRFALYPATHEPYEFALRLYHELGLGFGFYGEGYMPTYCRAGGNGPTDYVCTQVSPTTIVVDSLPE